MKFQTKKERRREKEKERKTEREKEKQTFILYSMPINFASFAFSLQYILSNMSLSSSPSFLFLISIVARSHNYGTLCVRSTLGKQHNHPR